MQLLVLQANLAAGDLLPTLTVGSEVYSNVNVTSVTTTDIHFNHAVGIGLSEEPSDDMRKMASPRVDYSVGSDSQAQTQSAVEVQGIPHAILMDAEGSVRFEGQPVSLDEQELERLMAKHAK